MKKYFFGLGILFSVCLFLFSPVVTYAHFPATDGNMTVTLHVDPDDDPVPTKQANLYFLFDDKTKKFTLANCNCVVTVTEQGKQIYQKSLAAYTSKTPSIWGAHAPFIFPNRDVYQISLKGEPKTKNAFQPFSLTWNFRVDQYPPVSPINNSIIIFGLVIFVGIIVFVCIRFV
jgi:hypothetical protein